MIKSGDVIEVNDKTAKIRIHRESSCGGDCGRCGGCNADEIIVEVENTLNLQTGETVNVKMNNKKFILSAVLGYGILVAVMIFGGILGYEAFNSEIASILFTLGFLAISLVVIRHSFKNKKSDIKVERRQIR